MDGNDRDLGWEDVGPNGPGGGPGGSQGGSGPSAFAGATSFGGQVGGGGVEGNISDAVTSAMVNHFARELTQGSLSLWPQLVQSLRHYFNVTHGYVLRKVLWQIVPLTSTKKKSSEGELGSEKDWTVRVYEGLEVDVEEPDLYIPTMGFVTYVILCGLVRGIQEQFTPDTISSTMTFAIVLLVLETTVAKSVLFMSGAVNAPTVDLAALLGYKFFYLSLQLLLGLTLGFGRRPTGFFYHLLTLGLHVSCGVALWQALRKLPRMQPAHGQECMADVHKHMMKGLPVMQALVCWCLLPSWPRRKLEEAAALTAIAVASNVAAAVPPQAVESTVEAVAKVAAAAAGGAS